jgi:hypothetical protein
MTAFLQTNETEIKRTSQKVFVPGNDVARLMYYLNCVCAAIYYTDDVDIQRLISYQN